MYYIIIYSIYKYASITKIQLYTRDPFVGSCTVLLGSFDCFIFMLMAWDKSSSILAGIGFDGLKHIMSSSDIVVVCFFGLPELPLFLGLPPFVFIFI